MSRPAKIGLIIGGSIAGLVIVLVVAAIITTQTPWFRNYVRAKIVSSVEDATGGTATVGSFSFEPSHLRAVVHDFVLHGTEPRNAAPLFRAQTLQVDLKPESPSSGYVGIRDLTVDRPQIDVIVYPDGSTNIPAPKIKSSSNKSGLETIVDLAIGRFNVNNGSITLADRKSDFSARGENLRVHFDYSSLRSSYTGELDMNPLYLQSDNNQTVDASVKIPITLGKDNITVMDASITTPESQVVLSGSMNHMQNPDYSAQVTARVALDEVKRAAGLKMQLDTANAPRILNANVNVSAANRRIQVRMAHLDLGQTTFDASGTMSTANPSGGVRFQGNLALGELGRLLGLANQPEGAVHIGGNATLQGNNQYVVTANVDGHNLSFRQGNTRVGGIDLASMITANPQRIEVAGLRVNALGGTLAGSGSLVNMAQFQFSGNLRNFDVARAASLFVKQPLPYDGVVSGPFQAQGNLKMPSDLVARANLRVAPGARGVPVSGRLNVDYNGRADTVTVAPSYLALPNTRIDVAGSLGQAIRVHMVSRNLGDLRPVASIPISFNRGEATLDATVSGKLSAPRIMGHLGMTNFAVEGRSFTSLAADFGAARTGVTVSNALLTRGPLQAQFSASVGLRDWKPEPYEPLHADLTVRNAGVEDIAALAGQSSVPVTGTLTADAHIRGTIGSPQGNADVTVANGAIEGNHFDQLVLRTVMTPNAIDVPMLQLVAGPSHVDASAVYQHPVNDLRRGSLRARVAGNQVQLADFQPLAPNQPGLGGTLSVNGNLAADLAPSRSGEQFQIASADANVAARGIRMRGKNLGDFTATATTSGSEIRYNLNSDFAGSTIRVNGQTLLTGNHETTAMASISKLPIAQVLAVAGRSDIPVSGTLQANAQLSGTLANPRATGEFAITRGSAYQEPFDRLAANVTYSDTLLDVPSLELVEGPANLNLMVSLTHPAGDYQDGQLRFRVNSNQIQLARLPLVEKYKPGLAGTIQAAADGAATLRRNQIPRFSTLNADLSARGLSVDKKPVGDLTARAETRGSTTDFHLNSDFGGSRITGSGNMQLAGDYPVNAQVTFANVTYSGLSAWTGGSSKDLDASAEGNVRLSGPAARPEALRGTLELTRLDVHSVSTPGGAPARAMFDLHNQGPVTVALDRSVVTIQSAHLTGNDADFSLTGNAALTGTKAVNVRATGQVNLVLLQAFSPNIFSAGKIVLDAAVTGTTAQPMVNGRVQLQNVSFNEVSLPAGITDANGTVTFNGTEAIIQNITGTSGGGKVTLAGFAGYGGGQLRVRLQATADKVRVNYPAQVTTEASAQITLEGTTASSLLSGNVSILQVALHSQTDIGSMLSQAAAPPAAPTTTTGFLAGMRFDLRIQTAPDVQFRTTLTQNLQADADVTLRGTVDHPGMLGRADITEGKVVFFGYTYNIDVGTITFYDPNKINPILNVSLETKAQGVDVTLTVSGPMDRMKLSYRSDPPLQFSDIVALLASGKTPTTDPVLAAHQPAAPQQSLTQIGASAVLGQAVANPVAGRLQRLFGVTRLKINPEILGTNNTAAATLTLQQQVTRDITFTYIQDVTQPNPQVIQVQWDIDPRWSAVAQRDIYGEFDLNFYYKKRFW
ncbi:MAG TPA: translocation/assembly module TamB domain-containing protein [Bryobacteraceae bacterium]|nr:translocation/assembly module TamB domain-containing protein [Bryobacteraceae bacterium]